MGLVDSLAVAVQVGEHGPLGALQHFFLFVVIVVIVVTIVIVVIVVIRALAVIFYFLSRVV